MIVLALVTPVLAANYYAYLSLEEEDGNAYEDTAFICSRNITQLVEYDIITTTGLDTRVLTGDGVPLPHMLSNDKILFVSDLAALEEKTLIFYTGATSLSSFPIVTGYNGYITTSDDSDLELGYVLELLVSGHFDSSAGTNKTVLYKEGAFKAWISGANTLRVAALNGSEDEQWALEYGSFTTGEHVVYIVGNGLLAHLYVDNMVTAKDTENLYESSDAQVSSSQSDIQPNWRSSFYAAGKYWAFYDKSYNVYGTNIYYKTSADGVSWSSEYTITTLAGYDVRGYSVCLQNGYLHLVYSAHKSGVNDLVLYRRGVPESDNSITWSAVEQTAVTLASTSEIIYNPCVAVDSNGYPFIVYGHQYSIVDKSSATKSSANDGTWSTAGGYPFELASESNKYHVESATNYPSSNKIYALWGLGNGDTNEFIGRYYNGSSWAGSTETIGSISYGNYFSAVADDDDNVYIAWEAGSNSSLRIRYSDGTFSSPVSLTGWTSPSVSYNDDNGYVYIIGIYGSNVVALALANGELSGIGTLFTPASTNAFLSATPYGNRIGIMYSSSSDYTQHGYLAFPWDWNDNSNNWTWMQNNVMSYADYFILGVDGEEVLEYEPATIIQGTTLPDIGEAGGQHDGVITWGSNPEGVTTSLGVFALEGEEEAVVGPLAPGQTDPLDMVGPTGHPGWTPEMQALTAHPFYPIVSGINYMGGLLGLTIPIPLIWIIGATFLLFIIIVLVLMGVRQGNGEGNDGGHSRPMHQMLAALAGGGWAAYCYSLGIYPFWVPVIFAVLALAIIIGERSPTVS